MIIQQSFDTASLIEIDFKNEIDLLQKWIGELTLPCLDFSQIQLNIPAYEAIIHALNNNFLLVDVKFSSDCPAIFQILKDDIIKRNIALKTTKQSIFGATEAFKEHKCCEAWKRQNQFNEGEKQAEQLGYIQHRGWRSWFSVSTYKHYGAYLVGKLKYQRDREFHDRYFAQLSSEFKTEFERQKNNRKNKHFGPLNKLGSTKLFENIVKQLLRNEKFIFSHDSNGEFWVKLNDESYNLTNLLNTVYYQHIELNTEDLELYLETENLSLCPTEEAFKKNDVQGKYLDMHFAQKVAIHFFGLSSTVNELMRNNLHHFRLSQDALRITMIRCAVIASGLRKIKNTDNVFFTFRGEDLFCQKIHDKRVELCNEGGISHYRQFISTSLRPTTQFHYKTQQIIFSNLWAKDISGLTCQPHEQEYLIPPTPVLWLKSQNDMGSNRTYFLAMPVESLDDYEEWCANKAGI